MKMPSLRNSHLTYGPKWPGYRTDNDSGNRYRYDEVIGAWIFSVGPEDC